MARQLMAAGHELVPAPEQADKVVVNTCAVTREAARDARSTTRRIHRDNPSAEILLTGCYATVAPQELARVEGQDGSSPTGKRPPWFSSSIRPSPWSCLSSTASRYCGSSWRAK